MKILVTGCAGFIGYHLVSKLCKNNKFNVFGIDNINSYYDPKLKKDRLKILKKYQNFTFSKLDMTNFKKLENVFKKNKFHIVINLAAQAGVRYSIENPRSFMETNVYGFFNILELSKIYKIKHLIYASTSSVYGSSNKFPLKEKEETSKPLSFYAATKKSNEVMAYSYSNIFKLPTTGLRFFTVYGPFGRPDMALFKFTDSIAKNKYLELFNNGNHERDFTYIDDIIDGIIGVIGKRPKGKIPFEVFNIGSNKPKHLKDFLRIIEFYLEKKAKVKKRNMQVGDVYKTHADVSKLTKTVGYKPKVGVKEGIEKFIKWYKNYYK